MIYLIVALNISITLLNIYIAIRIWQLRLIIGRIAKILVNYEQYFALVLPIAPIAIYRGQNRLLQTRQGYQFLQWQISKIRQLIWLLNWSYRTWYKS